MLATAEARRAGWKCEPGDWFEVEVDCVFARPASHFNAGGSLKKKALPFPGHREGDCANFMRGVCDTITKSKAVWLDDSRVVLELTRKRYAGPGEAPKTIVTIRKAK